MSKVTLNKVESGFLSQAALNSNFDTIENELQNKVLYRDNPAGEPNSMQQDLDMNGHRILNILGEGGGGFIWKQSWNDGLDYELNNIVYVPSGLWEGYTMICREDHTSSPLFQTDYGTNKWEILASRGASGTGSGDLVAANNLSDVASTSAALTNLNGMPKSGGTFTGDIIVPDDPYDADSWDENNEVPTKNAVRDKIESLPVAPTILNGANDPTFESTSSSEVVSADWTNGKLTGVIFDWAGPSAPPGALALPPVPTNVSRTTYARLFSKIGTTWGVGDGSTTFGIPYCPANFTTVQANGNVGTTTSGQMPAHGGHVSSTPTGFFQSGGPLSSAVIGVGTSNAGSGSNNLAAGIRVLKCIWI